MPKAGGLTLSVACVWPIFAAYWLAEFGGFFHYHLLLPIGWNLPIIL